MKSSILVSGLINIETTLQVERFPVEYEPVRYPFFGINNTISGVGYNVAKALHTLGCQVKLLSMVGRDFAGELAIKAIQSEGLPTQGVIAALAETPQSVILYDRTGARIVNTDLKDIQEHSYPPDLFSMPWNGHLWLYCATLTFHAPSFKLAAVLV
jgi:acarbose 7IV-phosphotransferase